MLGIDSNLAWLSKRPIYEIADIKKQPQSVRTSRYLAPEIPSVLHIFYLFHGSHTRQTRLLLQWFTITVFESVLSFGFLAFNRYIHWCISVKVNTHINLLRTRLGRYCFTQHSEFETRYTQYWFYTWRPFLVLFKISYNRFSDYFRIPETYYIIML